MKYIILTQGKFTAVDDADFDWLNQYKWHAHKDLGGYYAKRTIHKNRKYHKIRMHRVIMNCPEDKQIDHINHNTLDNRKCNLRICTFPENQRNRLPRLNCSSQYKGVCWHKQNKKWVSRIKLDQKNYSLGSYDSEIEAARAYNTKATELFGNFAVLNNV